MEELIVRSKNGDKQAFTELILSIQNELYQIAKIKLSNDYDINDAIQETMLNAYKHLKKLKDNSSFKSWIIKILINECNTIYKKKYKKHKLFEKIHTDKYINNIDNSIQKTDSNLNFELIINNLSEEEQLILTLHYNSKYSCSEISKILNMNINTVKSKLKRSKDKIKENYKGGVYYE